MDEEAKRLEYLRLAVQIVSQATRADTARETAALVLEIAQRLASFGRTGVVKSEP